MIDTLKQKCRAGEADLEKMLEANENSRKEWVLKGGEEHPGQVISVVSSINWTAGCEQSI